MNPEQEAMEIMMAFGKDGCQIMDSGGKDSTVLKYIADKCHEKYGLEYSVHHSHTTIDAPETVYFIRHERERLQKVGVPYTIHYPKKNFDTLCIEHGMLPTRIVRFCCKDLKESYGNHERVVTGVRKSESTARKNNQGIATVFGGAKNQTQEIEDNPSFMKTDKGGVVLLNYDNENVETVKTCFRTNKVLVNPLINWTDDDVWRCIRDNDLPMNPLYECGFDRVGCIGCPMAQRRRRSEFERYPKYRDRYVRIADKIVAKTKERCERNGVPYTGADTGLKYFKIWIEDPNVDGQLSLDMEGNITEDYT